MNHLRGYATAVEAARSKAAQRENAVIDTACPCGLVHVKVPAAGSKLKPSGFAPRPGSPPRLAIPAPRSPRGGLTAAVRLVLAGEATAAQAARDFGCDPIRVHDKAWAEAKRLVMEAHSRTCLFGGCMAQDVHHRRRRGAGGTADPVIAYSFANLAPLCRRHHDFAHRATGADRAAVWQRGFMLSAGQDPALTPLLAFSPDSGAELIYLLPSGGISCTDPRKAALA